MLARAADCACLSFFHTAQRTYAFNQHQSTDRAQKEDVKDRNNQIELTEITQPRENKDTEQ
ncbi:MAG: hypothetical protein GAK38_04515 [Xylophilus sp.]|nr:MAG: hypothetical protein GAK38_04515 [Xylophilus sp.]